MLGTLVLALTKSLTPHHSTLLEASFFCLKVLWHEKNRLIPTPYFELWCQLPNNEWDSEAFIEIGSSSNDIKVTTQNYVSRDLKQAREILTNVSQGKFPR